MTDDAARQLQTRLTDRPVRDLIALLALMAILVIVSVEIILAFTTYLSLPDDGKRQFNLLLFGALLVHFPIVAIAANRLLQFRRDSFAQAVGNRLKANRSVDVDFCLFLRPFRSKGKMRAPGLGGPAKTVDLLGNTRDLEGGLTEAVADLSRLPVVCLGVPGEHVGAGRALSTDADWQFLVKELINHAKLIIVQVSGMPGTQWELQMLLAGDAAQKCLFICPPRSRVLARYDSEADYYSGVNTFEEAGFSTPEWNEHGVAFVYNEGSRYDFELGFSDNRTKHAVSGALARLLPNDTYVQGFARGAGHRLS